MEAISLGKNTLFAEPIAAGFPSPAAGYLEGRLDLNEHLIRHPAATFFVRATGDSMTGAGIFDGDILIVDRSLKPASSNIVVALLDGGFTVKRLLISDGKVSLAPENPRYRPIEVNAESELRIWGVVTYVIHKAGKR